MPIEREFELPINWRIARNGFRSPVLHFADWDRSTVVPRETDLTVFVKQDCRCDVLALRDWLHDDGHNSHGYRLFGRFRASARFTTLLGLSYMFFREADACFFRLRCCGL